MDHLFRNIKQNAVTALHIYFDRDQCLIRSCTLKKVKKKIKVLFQGEAEVDNSFNISDISPEGIPLLIFVNSPDIIYKSDSGSFDAVFPNVEHENFISQSVSAREENLHAIMRKEGFYSIIEKIGIAENDILKLSVAPDFMKSCLPFIENVAGKQELLIDHYKFSFTSDLTITSIYHNSEHVDLNEVFKIGEEIIEGKYLLAFSMALAFLIDQDDINTIEGVDFSNSYSYWGARKSERYLIRIGVPILLVASLVIALFYFVNFNKNAELSNNKAFYQQYFQKYNQLKTNYDEKQSMISELGWTRNEKLSKLINLITESQPQEIELSQLFINPYDQNKFRKESIFIFDDQKVILEGYCSSATLFSLWVEKLSESEWVKNIQHQQYIYDEFQKKGQFSLEIQLLIK